MIVANELRRSNLVFFRDGLNGGWHKVTVSGIVGCDKLSTHYQIWYSSKMLVGSTNDLECIKPIPLTEEILLNSGFEKTVFNDHTDNYNLHPLQILYNVANGFEYFHQQFGGKFVKLASVHQLQNLYFALAKKELEVKL